MSNDTKAIPWDEFWCMYLDQSKEIQEQYLEELSKPHNLPKVMLQSKKYQDEVFGGSPVEVQQKFGYSGGKKVEIKKSAKFATMEKLLELSRS